MSPEPGGLTLRHAVALGVLHGQAELVPVSSSAHVALIPALAGWPYADLPADVRKAFEVALHTGTLVALLAVVPRPRPPSRAGPAPAPPPLIGLLAERPIRPRPPRPPA